MIRFITFILLFPPIYCFAQSIDEITTDQQALGFVKKHPIRNDIDFGYSLQANKPVLGLSKDTSDKLFPSFHSFEKADFDNNGHTDLLFNGYNSYWESDYCRRVSLVIFAFGNDSFRVQDISHIRHYAFFSASLFKEGKNNLIITRSATWEEIEDSSYLKISKDTLFAFKGNLIEKRPASNYPIEKISYYLKTQLLIDRAPGFELILQSDSSRLIQEVYTDDGSHWNVHVSVSKTPTELWIHLCDLFNQMNFTSMNDKYNRQGSMHTYGIFEISYGIGKTKKISDYLMPATLGIEAIEKILFNYFSTQPSRKINTPAK